AAQVTVTGSVSHVTVTAPFQVTTGESTATVYRPVLDLASAGGAVVASGSGFAPNELIAIHLDGAAAAQTVRADSSGSFIGVRLAAPADGDHAVVGAGVDSLLPVSASFTVRSGTVSVAS
ncbi:MAG TPA: hypothetical protein VGJ38_06605, partial [Jatrophihabitantaceae bacterium]